MKRLALAALLVPFVIGAPAQAAGTTVIVADMAFDPGTVRVAVGESVTWSFQDSVAHTTTSDQGFWDSGTEASGSTYARTFTSAGTFAYHCTIHTMMRGKVAVTVKATGSPSKGWTLRWATGKGTGGVTFDVQTRMGGGKWTTLVSGTTSPSQRFDPTKPGGYAVRARTVQGSAKSRYSPASTFTVS